MVAYEDNMYTTTSHRRGANSAPNMFYKHSDDKTQVGLAQISKDKVQMGTACYKITSQCLTQGRQTGLRHKTKRRTSMRRSNTNSKAADDLNNFIDDCSSSHTKCILSKVSSWGFDVFALDKATNGRPLFHVILKLFQHHNLMDYFQIDPVKLMKFATLVEDGYKNNPYHNAIHAADVTQAMHCYISQTKIAKHMTPIEILIALVSAAVHDLDHPGVNQGFLIATNNYLATMYENKAVLEKHHWKTAIDIIHKIGLFDHLSESVRTKIEEEMRSLILATDMTRQQEFFTILRDRINAGTLDMSEYNDRHFILQIALKCADISNPCRHWSVCKNWSERVCEEFFRQGDLERNLELPISMLCDRYTNTVPKIQTGFIGFVVEPLFVEFEKYLFPCSTLSEQISHLRLNKTKWQEKVDKATTKQANRPTSLDLSLVKQEDIPSDIPSPTHSSDDECEDAENLARTCQCHLVDLHDSLDRRHSVPAINILRDSQLLSRRQSLPIAYRLRAASHPNSKLDQVILLNNLAGQLTTTIGEDSNNNSDDYHPVNISFTNTLKDLFSNNNSTANISFSGSEATNATSLL